jgi:hypothetical protein
MKYLVITYKLLLFIVIFILGCLGVFVKIMYSIFELLDQLIDKLSNKIEDIIENQ